jgi:hypothetical protein
VGSCFCGAVKLRLHTASPPLFRIACHCHDCRAFHGAPYVHSVGYALDSAPAVESAVQAGPFTVVQGGDQVGRINKTGMLER